MWVAATDVRSVEPSNSKLWVSEMTKNFDAIVDCNAIVTGRIKALMQTVEL